MKNPILLTSLTCAATLIGTNRAEEYGNGHYVPGATASFMDVLPGREAFVYVNAFNYYSGSAGGSHLLPLGGNVVANADATVYADTSLLLYETPWKILGLQYAAAVAIPYVWMDVKGTVQLGPQSANLKDSANGIGDIQLLPLMLGWKQGDLSAGANFSIYAPSGDFEIGRLANVGKNFWTFQPSLNLSWLSHKTGTEVTVFTGMDFSTKNDATDYQSGAIVYLDGTVAQHLPLFGGLIGVGASGYYYQQVTGDSGSGAKLGDFEGMSAGVGPVLSYATKLGRNKKTDLAIEVKWLPEVDVENRLKGDAIWFKLAVAF